MAGKLLSFLVVACLALSSAAMENATAPTENPDTTNSTAAGKSSTTPTNSPTTESSSVGPSTELVTSSAPTTAKPDPCDLNPCGQGSTCQDSVGNAFVCLCLPGDNYNYVSKSCETAKVYPGQLGVPGIKYEENMKDKNSPEFKNAAQTITNEVNIVFKETADYSNSTVVELLPPQSKVELRSGSGLIASIEIIFKTSSNITAAGVKEKIKGASGIFNGGSFSETNLCTRKACDVTTTNCTPKDGSFNCSCLDDYIKTNYSDRVCIACPSGKEAKNSVECVPCSFGYSGLNCSESWQLVLVIVGSVLGGLLLIALILLPVVALRPSKKNANADIGKPYVSHSPAKAPLVNSNSNFANSQAPSVNGSAYGGAAVPRIPRATTTNPWDNRTDLEMTPSNSRQNLIPGGRNMRPHDDRDDMNPYSQPRPQSNLYPQSRPQNNPYAQNRAQINPYAQSQGQSNPYFTNDDGRRFN